MSEFSAPPPPPPPPSKPFPWKIVIPIVIVVLLLCCLCLTVVGVVALFGSGNGGLFSFGGSRSVVGDWNIYYSWDCTGSYNGPVLITFFENGNFEVIENSESSFGTWYVSGSTLDFTFDDYPNANYVGTLDSSRTYVKGTMSNLDNDSGCFYAQKR